MSTRVGMLLVGLMACSRADRNAVENKPMHADLTAPSMNTPKPPTTDALLPTNPIRFTHLAATKIIEIRAEEQIADDRALRLEVRTITHAPGFEYNLYFDERRKPGDREFDTNGIKVVLDPMSHASLVGTEVDFFVGPQGAGFKFNNPNVSGGDDGAPEGPPTFGVLDP